MPNDKQMEKIAQMLSKSLGKKSDELMKDMKNGDINSALNNLSEDNKSRINAVLSNPEIANKLMADKGVQDILRKLDL